jgi:hypothetical protein
MLKTYQIDLALVGSYEKNRSITLQAVTRKQATEKAATVLAYENSSEKILTIKKVSDAIWSI